MTELSSQILARIRNHYVSTLPLDNEMVLPNYEGLSLANLPCTVAHLLNAPDFGSAPLDEDITEPLNGPYEKVVLLLVDALGYALFNRLLESQHDIFWKRYADQAIFSPITSVCPSTTASALTTLWTGVGPAEHGIIGYEMWAREFGMVINNILHSPATSRGDVGGLSRAGFDPHTFLDTPLLGTHLQHNGVATTTFIHSAIAHSGLSMMQMNDVDVHTFVDEADLCVSLADYINSRRGIREYIYVYYSDVDTLMHRYNAYDMRVAMQFRAFSSLFEEAFLNRVDKTIRQKSLMILMADHGSKVTPKYDKYDLNQHPEFMNYLVMQPTCENRLAFFFIKPGKLQAVRNYFEQTWPDKFILFDPDTALQSGLFGKGPFKPTSRDRLGDLIAVAKGDAYLWWAQKPNPMAGRHGGLSIEEMLVPFYALPLRNLA
ncbi:MAG: alkaline phosphatase family protein [Chloroflexota bacterium]|nr:alkaline phosphatase family protein [Chloroflexota bacterium]